MASGTPADRTDRDAADAEVRAFVDAVPGATRRRDAETLLELFGRITNEPPRMWYSTIIGFGSYHYKYPSGREGDASIRPPVGSVASTSLATPTNTGPPSSRSTVR